MNKLKSGKWVLFNLLVWVLGLILVIFVLGPIISLIPVKGIQFNLGLGMGAGVGLLQYLFLRKQFKVSFQWVLISALGMGLPFLLFDGIQLFNPIINDDILLYSLSLGAITISLLQYLQWKKHYKTAGYWIVTSTLGWMSSFGAIKILDALQLQDKWIGFSVNLSLILVGGVILGKLTSYSLRKLVK